MDARKRCLSITVIAVLVAIKLGLLAGHMGALQGAYLASPMQSPLTRTPTRKAQPFTPAEVSAFLVQANRARVIDDSLQRCLAFPDPSGSHWSHDAVAAYCRYTTQSAISVAELTTLIQNDHADQVDALLADALQKQRTQPDARGLLDRTFIMDFRDSSLELRGILDAWKRQSPHSAFAYAASGDAYVIAAHDARGGDIARLTSGDHFESMGRLLQFADDDFSKALAIDPTLMPAYAGMIESGTYGSHGYGLKAVQKALAVDSSNFSIYVRLMQLSEPKWGGSIGSMQKTAMQALAHVAQNPLLELLATDAPAYMASRSDCDCVGLTYVPDYRSVFQKVTGFRPLATAASVAYTNEAHGAAIGLVYSAETLRFAPEQSDARLTLSYELSKHGAPHWAKEEGDQFVAELPSEATSYNARGKAYETLQDYPRALDDYSKAFALDPASPWPLVQTGIIDVHKTHDWDKAWANANQLIKLFPDHPEGWILRLSVEKDQPRVGFHDDGVYFLAHFSHDPNQQAAVREVTQWVAEGKYR